MSPRRPLVSHGRAAWSLKRGVSAAGMAVALLWGNAVLAQQAEAPDPAAAPDGEIVVTALKRKQNIQDVPVSISALSSDLLSKMGAQDFSQVADSVPGVAFATTGVGNSQYIIRGIGTVGVAQSPTTGVYLDETPLQTRALRGASQPDPQLFDIARVEVLRGPQGVLFGSSAMGGLVRIVTNQPDATKTAGTVEGSVGAVRDGSESWDLKGMVNLPLVTDTLALRVSGSYVHQGGWIDDLRPKSGDLTENVINDPKAIKKDDNWSNTKTVRGALRWTPTPTLTITPSVIWQDAYANTDRTFSDANFGLRARTKARWQDTYAKDKFVIGTLVVQNDFDALGGFTLLSSSSYLDRKTHLFFDVTAFYSPTVEDEVGPGPGGDLYPVALEDISHSKQFTQEVRMVSKGNGPLQYTIGAYYRNLKQDSGRTISVTNMLGRTAPAPLGDSNPPIISTNTVHFKESEIAGFGELTYAVTKGLKVAAGARVFSYKQTEGSFRYGEGGAAGGDLSYNYLEHNKESGVTPRFTVSFEPSRVATFYASYSRGFRTGGVNAPITNDVCTPQERASAGLPDTPPPYKSDKTDNYEIGAKTQFLGGALHINGSLYDIEWQGYQQAFQTTCGINNEHSVSFVVNAGKVRSRGGELEVQATPMQGLNLQGGLSYTDATYRNAVPELFLDAGSRVLDVPRITWNGSASYSFPLSDALSGNLFFAGHHVGATNSGFGEGEVLPRPAYTLLDASIGIRTGSQLSLDVFVDNLTDAIPVYGQEFATSPGNTTATSYFAYHVGPPRTIGIRISKSF